MVGHVGEAAVGSVLADVQRVQKGLETTHYRLDEVRTCEMSLVAPS